MDENEKLPIEEEQPAVPDEPRDENAEAKPEETQDEEQETPAPETDEETTEPQEQDAPQTVDIAAELAELKQRQTEAAEELAKLNKQFEKRLAYVDYEEKIVDSMHKELQAYKEDLKFQLIKPLLLDIISVAAAITRMSDKYRANPEGEQDIPNEKFLSYADDLNDILENNGVDKYKSSEGDAFVPLKQKSIKQVETEDESLNGKIAKSYTYGYERDGKRIAAEQVAVYILKKQGE